MKKMKKMKMISKVKLNQVSVQEMYLKENAPKSQKVNKIFLKYVHKAKYF